MDEFQIAEGVPDVATYLSLRRAGGLSAFSEDAAGLGLAGTFFGVLVRRGDDIVGMGRLVGDGGCFFQVVDIVVHPACQGRGVGKRIMEALHVRIAQLPDTAHVSLLADVPADGLYEKFGFRQTAPVSVGMSRRV